MSVEIFKHVDDVLENLSTHKDATILAGGTDLLVELNFGRIRPAHIVAIDRVDELKDLSRNGHVRMGALVTYTRMLETDAVDEIVDLYFGQCSILVDCRDLACGRVGERCCILCGRRCGTARRRCRARTEAPGATRFLRGRMSACAFSSPGRNPRASEPRHSCAHAATRF